MASRTWHDTSAAYLLPNDATEHERLDLQTRCIDDFMHGHKILAPLTSPKRILDVGCGTGINTRWLAEKFPEAEVIGVDLSQVPPSESTATFVQADFHDWADTEAIGKFDYIFSRLLVFGVNDWPRHIAQMQSLLAPGGWIELQEIQSGTAMDEAGNNITSRFHFLAEMNRLWPRVNLDTQCAAKLAGWLRDAGLSNVEEKVYHWAVTPWDGHPEADGIASYSRRYLPPAIAASAQKIPKITSEELETFEKSVHQWYDESGIWHPWVVALGQKPF